MSRNSGELIDDDKVTEAVEWIEKAARSRGVVERFHGIFSIIQSRIENPSLDDILLTRKMEEILSPFTDFRVAIERIDGRDGNQLQPETPRLKYVLTLKMPLESWMSQTGLNRSEAELFRSYMPTIPNNWYYSVRIENSENREMLAVEQHHILTYERSAKFNTVEEELVISRLERGE